MKPRGTRNDNEFSGYSGRAAARAPSPGACVSLAQSTNHSYMPSSSSRSGPGSYETRRQPPFAPAVRDWASDVVDDGRRQGGRRYSSEEKMQRWLGWMLATGHKELDVPVDDGGWVQLDSISSAIRRSRPDFGEFDRSSLHAMLEQTKDFELDIRVRLRKPSNDARHCDFRGARGSPQVPYDAFGGDSHRMSDRHTDSLPSRASAYSSEAPLPGHVRMGQHVIAQDSPTLSSSSRPAMSPPYTNTYSSGVVSGNAESRRQRSADDSQFAFLETAACASKRREPPKPPGDHWESYQSQEGSVWWYYEGPAGRWWWSEEFSAPQEYVEDDIIAG